MWLQILCGHVHGAVLEQVNLRVVLVEEEASAGWVGAGLL